MSLVDYCTHHGPRRLQKKISRGSEVQKWPYLSIIATPFFKMNLKLQSFPTHQNNRNGHIYDFIYEL
jgi:hypothetical protein